MSPAQVVSIPIDHVEPHPKLALRFTYDVASLADLIEAAADENTPNGQLEPGRVVPKDDGGNYFAYVGVRRYLAIRRLFESTHDRRFFTYNAYVDTGLSELQMFVRAKMENEDEKGERQGLSVLEEVFGLNKIKDSVSGEELDGDLKREFDVAVRLSDEKLRRLFQVETTAHFRFRLGHLERLSRIEDEGGFYMSAASVAGFNVDPEGVEQIVAKSKDSAYALDWFKRLFPEFKDAARGYAAAQPQTTAPSGAGASRGKAGQKQAEQQLEVHERNALAVPCPACQKENMLLLRLMAEVTRLPNDPRGPRATATPDAVVRYKYRCNSCPEQFYVFVEPIGGKLYAAETSLSSRFREPKVRVKAVDLRVDRNQNVWQRVEEGKVAGGTGRADAAERD